MPRVTLVSAFMLVALSGCFGADNDLQGTATIAEACQLRGCECVEANPSFILKRKRADILWHKNGNAYCPAGFELALKSN